MITNRLFLPLNKLWYQLFLNGTKTWEIRGISTRFNTNTIYKGRRVELSNGYQKKGRVFGTIQDIILVSDIYDIPEDILPKCLPITITDPL